MVEVRDQRRQERADARAGRRSEGSDSSDESGIDVKRAITTAAAAAVVGGLAGALKAFADRPGGSSAPEEPKRAPDPSSQAEEPDDEAPQEEPAERQDDEPSAEQHEPDEEEQQPEPTAAPSGDVAKVIARARQHVGQVLGEEPEGVSGIERTNGNWCVNVEIVKLHRIPESTDVLASYAVVVDGDGDLVSLQETRRYRRSQSEEDR
jgi:hypothetical protein